MIVPPMPSISWAIATVRPAARYARLTDDIGNDITRLLAFFETAGRVLDIDNRRRRSLAYIRDLGPKERANGLSRMDENASIIEVGGPARRTRLQLSLCPRTARGAAPMMVQEQSLASAR
jgi:hypothetical protein